MKQHTMSILLASLIGAGVPHPVFSEGGIPARQAWAGTAQTQELENIRAEWPAWRGPNGDGTSPETDWNPASLSNPPRVVWSAEVGQGYSSMAVKDGLLYTMGYSDGKDTVYCLDSRTGETLWSYSYRSGTGQYPGTRATPAVDDGAVYTLGRRGDLFSFNAKNGKVLWQKNLGRDFGMRSLRRGYSGSPVIEGDLLILNSGAAGMALEKKPAKKFGRAPKMPAGTPRPFCSTTAESAMPLSSDVGRWLW